MTVPNPTPNFEWRDGKIYYIGPTLPKSVMEPPVTPMTLEEREKLFDEVAESLTDYDFDAVTRLREMERKLPPGWDKDL